MNLQRYLIIVAALVWAAGAGLAADVPGHISYQGMLLDAGAPFTGEANFRFALVDSLTGDFFWSNDGTAGYPAEAIRIPVQDGLFSVLLGAAPMAPIDPSTIATFTRDQALRIWVEIGSHGEVLLGNLPLSSVLFAHQAELARASAGDFAAAGQIWSQSGGFKFPDGTVQQTAATAGGGDCLWSAGTGSKIYYNAGNVGIGTDDPTYPLSIEKSAGSNIVPMTLFRTTGTGSAAALRFQNALDNHFNLGITGGSHLALGYNANIGLSGDVVRITPEGNVGIGRTNPSAKLDVNGTVRMTGMQLGTSATAGHVLTADASGIGTWQPVPGGGGYWINDGEDNLYYGSGNVGIGMGSSQPVLQPLHVIGTTYLNGNVGIGVAEPASALHVAGTARVTGFQLGTSATAGHVLTTDASGAGTWQAPAGAAGPWQQSGSNIYYDGGNVGIGNTNPGQKLDIGETSDYTNYLRFNSSASGFSGIHFTDTESGYSGMIQYVHTGDYMRFYTRSGESSSERVRITSTGDVGIGTTSPATRLHVNGTTRTNGFQLGSSATAGHVLTADASGVGTWQAPPTGGGGDFVLPYAGEASGGGSIFQITNTHASAGTAIEGTGASQGIKGTGTTEYSSGVYGWSGSGHGVYGTTNSGKGVRASATAGGTALYAYGNGTTTSNPAAHIENSNSNGIALYSTSQSTDANAVIVNRGSGDLIKGYSGSSGGNLVFKVDNSGETTVSVLHITGGSDLAERFAVTTQAEPGMVVAIDPVNPGKLRIAEGAYNRRVAGVVSGANGVDTGMLLSSLPGETDAQPIALSGRVWVYCDAREKAIEPGDMLTTSSRPGHAMAVSDFGRAHGAVLGKAMTALAKGEKGMVLALVNLQ